MKTLDSGTVLAQWPGVNPSVETVWNWHTCKVCLIRVFKVKGSVQKCEMRAAFYASPTLDTLYPGPAPLSQPTPLFPSTTDESGWTPRLTPFAPDLSQPATSLEDCALNKAEAGSKTPITERMDRFVRNAIPGHWTIGL
jgi:hypothetical protein